MARLFGFEKVPVPLVVVQTPALAPPVTLPLKEIVGVAVHTFLSGSATVNVFLKNDDI